MNSTRVPSRIVQGAERSPRPSSEAIISATGLRRTYGRGVQSFEAVRGIDLSVQRGELFALLGTNGAGKTSTMEVLEGLAPAGEGSVRVMGVDPYRARRRIVHRVGVMLQETGFPESLTVAEIARMWHGTLSYPRRIDAVLGEVNLLNKADIRVRSLSGGERRRLDLGLALMGHPELVFLDEPTTGLDPQSRELTWDLIRSLLDDGTTIVLTTHYLEEAEALATHLAIMHRGVVSIEGTVEEIVSTQLAQIRFEVAGTEGLPLADLPSLVGRPRFDATRLVLESSDLQATLTCLLARAEQHRVRLKRLTANAATLQQAFLKIADTEPVPED